MKAGTFHIKSVAYTSSNTPPTYPTVQSVPCLLLYNKHSPRTAALMDILVIHSNASYRACFEPFRFYETSFGVLEKARSGCREQEARRSVGRKLDGVFFSPSRFHPGPERVDALLPPPHQPPLRPGGRGRGGQRPGVSQPTFICLCFSLSGLYKQTSGTAPRTHAPLLLSEVHLSVRAMFFHTEK